MPSNEKLDLLKLHKAEYKASARPVILDVGEGLYLRISGCGAPGSQPFEKQVEALYGMAYTLKFNSKFAGRDYGVSKLEALFGVDGQSVDEFATLDKAQWKWRLLIRVPEFTTTEHLDEARTTLRKKGKEGNFDAVVLDSMHEGTCVQMLHVGSYEQEAETLKTMRDFAQTQGMVLHRWHHEIYLSDPRRVPEERLKTLLRHPLKTLAPRA